MKKLVLFGAIFCVCLIMFGLETVIVGDAVDYWNRGLQMWQNGRFSVLNVEDGFRGYVYPLYCGICNLLGGGKIGFKIINSLLVSVYFVFIVPKLHGIELFNKKSALACIVHFLVFSLFFYGSIIYTLSDLFAIVLCTACIVFLKKCEEYERWEINIQYSVLFGAFLYMSYNVRTIYLFADVYLLLVFLISQIKRKKKIYLKFISTFGVLLGGTIAAAPQLYMNYKMLGIISGKVPTQGLMLSQLGWGLRYQRYDTYVSMLENHPNAQVYFIDPVGSALLDKLGISVFADWLDFFSFIFKYPFEVAGIYIRHLVNGVLPCWPNLYVVDLDSNKIILGVIAYILFFLFIIACFSKAIKNNKVFNNYIALLVPVLFILPGAVEVRFFIALYIMIIGVLCYNVDWLFMKEYILRNWLKIFIVFVGIGGLVFSTWSSMLASESINSLFFY